MLQQRAIRAAATRADPRTPAVANPARAAWEDSYLEIWSIMFDFTGILQSVFLVARGGGVAGPSSVAARTYLEVRQRQSSSRLFCRKLVCSMSSPLTRSFRLRYAARVRRLYLLRRDEFKHRGGRCCPEKLGTNGCQTPQEYGN